MFEKSLSYSISLQFNFDSGDLKTLTDFDLIKYIIVKFAWVVFSIEDLNLKNKIQLNKKYFNEICFYICNYRENNQIYLFNSEQIWNH